MSLKPLSVQCPYCWQEIEILIDPSVTTQDYIEDCSVCCMPIRFKVHIDSNGCPHAKALSQND